MSKLWTPWISKWNGNGGAGWGGGVSLAVERQVDYWGSPCNVPSSVF